MDSYQTQTTPTGKAIAFTCASWVFAGIVAALAAHFASAPEHRVRDIIWLAVSSSLLMQLYSGLSYPKLVKLLTEEGGAELRIEAHGIILKTKASLDQLLFKAFVLDPKYILARVYVTNKCYWAINAVTLALIAACGCFCGFPSRWVTSSLAVICASIAALLSLSHRTKTAGIFLIAAAVLSYFLFHPLLLAQS